MTIRACLIAAFACGSTTLGAQASSVEAVVVGPGGPIAGAVVYLVPVRGDVPVGPVSSTVISQRNLRFEPRIVAIAPGSVVSFPNDDDVVHNVFHPGRGNAGFDLGSYDPDVGRSATFRDEGVFTVLCQLHPEMAAYVVVVYAAARGVTDERGRLILSGLRPGAYRVRSWHRRFRNIDQVVVLNSGIASLTLTLVPGTPVAPGTSQAERK